MGIVAGVAGVASAAYSAYSAGEAEDKMGGARKKYSKTMGVALDAFMSVWRGTPPKGYQTWDQYNKGGHSQIGYIPGLKLKHPLQQMALKEMMDNGLPLGELAKLKKLGSITAQEKFLSDKWGTDVKLNKKYVWGKIDAQVGPGGTAAPGTFNALDEIRDKGGTPSIEQQYLPWIQPGEDAYEAMSKAIVGGDMSGFFTDPGYEWRKSEGEKAINRIEASGRMPNKAASEAMLDLNQNMATNEYSNYLNRLNSLAGTGYNALSDLKSLEAHYKGSGLETMGGVAGNLYSMEGAEANLGLQKGEAITGGINALGNLAGNIKLPTSNATTTPTSGTTNPTGMGIQWPNALDKFNTKSSSSYPR